MVGQHRCERQRCVVLDGRGGKGGVVFVCMCSLDASIQDASLIAVFNAIGCHSFSNRLMFVLFADVSVVVSDVLAVDDVLTYGVLCGFQ